MKYKVQFNKGWVGTWVFDATDDVAAWKTALDKIKEHTQVITVGVEAIYEVDSSNNQVRKLPDEADCKKNKKKSKNSERQPKTAMYKAYFSDGECSGPYIVKSLEEDIYASDFDSIAIELAKEKLKQHIDYNGLDSNKIIVIQVEALNGNDCFIVNLPHKYKKKNPKDMGYKQDRKNRFLMLQK